VATDATDDDTSSVVPDHALRSNGASRSRWSRVRRLTRQQWLVVAQTAVVLPAVQLSLWRRGLGPTAARLARRSHGPIVANGAGTAERAAEAVALVAGRPVVGARCLGRSLVLWFLLRRRGIDADLVIGAAPPRHGTLPAHAWVEVAGTPVNDRADVREQFGSFGLQLPRLGTAEQASSR